MVRDYIGEKDNRNQEISTTTRRVELSEIADNGCVSSYGIDQSSKNRGVEEIRMEWKVEIGQENAGGFEMVGLDDQGEQSKDVRFENTYILSNDGCGDNRMGSGIGGNGEGGGIGGESWEVEQDLELEVFKLTRNSSSVNGTKINEKLLSEGDCNDHQHGQCGNGVEYQEMESQETDVVIGKKDLVSGNGYGYTVTYTTHSGNGEQSSGSTEQDINEGGLLDQTRSTKRSTKPVRTSYMVGRLCDKNEQTIAKVLQLVFRQRSIQINQILKALAKVERDKAQAIIIVLDLKGQVWSSLLSEMRVDEVDLGLAEECLERNQVMADLNLQVPPGRMKAVRVISTQLKRNCLGEGRGELGQMEMQLTT
ncbi:MAG: hypothetical protein EZS28_035568 [Streblomastix strix]|uniref:Uncharacterized protein n=1 Tax=Streblomastix strix TaxID=222440 RepID=A0A5J4UDN3_9EUKA|nr:MAG: hypothetical protein EZS28_035568 [Streblomastix strix]